MRKFIAVFMVFVSFQSKAQEGYKIDFVIEGLQDTTVYLGNFFGESTYLKDTAQVDDTGAFTFDGNKRLPAGIYFLVMNKTRIFDIIINEDQQFKITTSQDDYIGDMVVEGDIDNELYLKNLRYNAERNKEAKPFVEVLQSDASSDVEKQSARERLNSINDKVIAFQDEIIAAHPKTVISKIFKATRPVEVPDAPEGADRNYAYQYYKSHYWDNFDLSDETMLRLNDPIYKKKIDEYLDKLVMQTPDSLTKEIFALAEIASKNEETYKYFVWTTMLKYQQNEIMGLDEVYVNMYDRFFETGEMDYWANASLKKSVKEQADKFRLSLIGNKAPNLIMMDQNMKPQSMYDIKNDYTVIYFYDPDCGFCKKETPVLKNFYDSTQHDVEIYAVSADTSMTKMRDYIEEMDMTWITVNGPRTYTEHYQDLYDAYSTPTLYVLDKDKKIIAKKLPAARLEDFLTSYEKMLKNREQQ